MNAYKLLRKQAAQKLDAAISAARKEYRETCDKINSLRRELGDCDRVKREKANISHVRQGTEPDLVQRGGFLRQSPNTFAVDSGDSCNTDFEPCGKSDFAVRLDCPCVGRFEDAPATSAALLPVRAIVDVYAVARLPRAGVE